MDTCAETAIVDYCSLFDDQGKQTSVFHFRLQQTNGSLPFPFPGFAANKRQLPFSLGPFSVCKIPETWRHGHGDIDMKTWRHGHGDKMKLIREGQAIFLNP
jgi:hypothetical protein